MPDRSARHDPRAVIHRWRELTSEASGEPGRTILVAASHTANPIAPAIVVTLADRGEEAAPLVRFSDYNQIFQLCLQPEAYGVGEADDIVVLWRIEDVFERDFHAWTEGDDGAFDRLLAGADALADALAQLNRSTSAAVVVSDAPVPVGFGLDHDDPAELAELVGLQTAVNRRFDDRLGDEPVERVRVAALQLATGTRGTFDRRNWLMYRQPYSETFSLELGNAIADVIIARLRVPPKVVVLDADDTLWAGIAADDGIGGLQAGDAFPGFAHRSFQYAVRRLRHRGVLLAVASKNDPETVTEAFEQVDGMVLGLGDIAGWRVSWGPKPPAIADLAAEFNLGLDSFVFVDDSIYEIGGVETQLPDVIALRVPEDIEELPDLLAESGLFRMMRVTDDDRERTIRMQAEASRGVAATTMSHDEFLADLDLHVELVHVGDAETGRVAQLVNKSNQFNLTTVRRSRADIEALVDSDSDRVFAISVHDRFGEYGIVGVVIASPGTTHGDAWYLDTVLMSCRVLGRGVETAMLAGVTAHLREQAAGPIRGRFIPTERNSLVADLLPRHGFQDVPAAEGSEARAIDFVLAADRSVELPGHITLDDRTRT